MAPSNSNNLNANQFQSILNQIGQLGQAPQGGINLNDFLAWQRVQAQFEAVGVVSPVQGANIAVPTGNNNLARQIASLQAQLQNSQIGQAVVPVGGQANNAEARAPCAECVKKQKEIDKLKEELLAKDKDIDEANARAESGELKDALDLVTEGKFVEANKLYFSLRQLRRAEVDRKTKSGDKQGADAAELYSANIKYHHAKMFKKQGYLDKAETLMKDALEVRKKLCKPDDGVVKAATTELCLILRAYKLPAKYQEAARLHREVWERHTAGLRFVSSEKWIMANGHQLGVTMLEQGLKEDALLQYNKVLRARNEALGSQDLATIASVIEVLSLQQQLGKSVNAADTIKKYLIPYNGTWTSQLIDCAIKVGQALHKETRYKDAELILQKVWEQLRDSKYFASDSKYNTGWELAWAMERQGDQSKRAAVKTILSTLLDERNKSKKPAASPKTLQVMNMLAWMCRYTDDFDNAEKHAENVWRARKAEEMNGPSYNTGVLLIWLLCRHSPNFTEQRKMRAKEVWVEVLRMKTSASQQWSIENLKTTQQRWCDLANDLTRFAEDRAHGGGSRLAKDIREHAFKLC